MPDKHKVDTRIITPQIAGDILKGNTANFRKIDRARVRKYAAEMASGNWEFNGETIKLNGSVLLDGQHRLTAIIESGVSVKCILVTGIDSDAAATIDTGKPRGIADWVRHTGKKNANSITAIARLYLVHMHGLWSLQGIQAGRIPDSEILDFIDSHDEALQSAHLISYHCQPLMQKSLVGAVMLIACEGRSPESNAMCSWFCESLHKGVNLTGSEPVLLLRNKFVGINANRRESPYMQKMLLSMAWNKTVKGELGGKLLKFALTGPTANIPINQIELAPW